MAYSDNFQPRFFSAAKEEQTDLYWVLERALAGAKKEKALSNKGLVYTYGGQGVLKNRPTTLTCIGFYRIC